MSVTCFKKKISEDYDIAKMHACYLENPTFANRERLVLACIPFIQYHVSKNKIVVYSTASCDDFVNYCVINLLKGIDSYDASRDACFVTYLYSLIKHTILRCAHVMDWRSAAALALVGRVVSETRKMSTRCRKVPDVADVLNSLRWTRTTYEAALRHKNARLVYLGSNCGTLEDARSISTFLNRADTSVDSWRRVEIAELAQLTKEILSKKAYTVVQMRISNFTYSEISERLNLTRQRVQQIYQDALRKVRRVLQRRGYENMAAL